MAAVRLEEWRWGAVGCMSVTRRHAWVGGFGWPSELPTERRVGGARHRQLRLRLGLQRRQETNSLHKGVRLHRLDQRGESRALGACSLRPSPREGLTTVSSFCLWQKIGEN